MLIGITRTRQMYIQFVEDMRWKPFCIRTTNCLDIHHYTLCILGFLKL